ncbi:hypothetical protein Daesc_007480 [Daldinia eschscholtzii]|uniref:Uncharacterized protein n=1 Tax=Daldinia eschscholtzii TaxID=292717 RepID=A0AAX6MFK8_9PEZI
MDNQTAGDPGGQTGGQAFLLLHDFPPEIRNKIWLTVAEIAANEFRRRHPEYNRFWVPYHKPPYVKYVSYTMEGRGDLGPSILRDLRELFWPLFRVNKDCYAAVTRYISKFHERKKAPQLVLNFLDILRPGVSSLDTVIKFSRRSTNTLKSQVAGWPGVTWPTIIQNNHLNQLEEITSTMNLTVAGSIFAPSIANKTRHGMLLRFNNLKKLYIDAEGHHQPARHHCEQTFVCVFLEVSEFRDGKLRMKFDDFESFRVVYQQKYDLSIGTTTSYRDPEAAQKAWRRVKQWEESSLGHLLAVVDSFTRKGTECIVVCRCRAKELHEVVHFYGD